MIVALPFGAENLAHVPDDVEVVTYASGEEPSLPCESIEMIVPFYGRQRDALALLHRMPRLKAVQLLTAGFENALPVLPDGVTLCNAAGVHDAATAEHAVGLMIASQRRYPELVVAQQERRWDQQESRALADCRVLVLGAGHIGRAIERRLSGFECDVVMVASRARHDVRGIDELPALLPGADVVVLILPLHDDTHHLFDASVLARMKDGALLVNVARGGVIDTDALVAELRSGRLRAALDVYEEEPLPASHPLWELPNAFVAPHVGGPAESMWPRAYRLVSRQVQHLSRGDRLMNVVAGPDR